jgi:glucose/mannose-6-phosphate isomerase
MTTEPTPVLDDYTRMQSVDRRNMLRLLNELPEQCETAMGISRSFAVEPLETKPNVIFITGSGDSSVAVDMAAAVLAEGAEVPVVSDHGGRLPRFVGEESLVFLVDYSGKGQDLLRTYKEARQRGANLICVASSGKLLEAASRDGVRTVKIPPGQPPRSAIGYLFVPVVVVVEKMGLAEGITDKLSHGIKHLKNVREAFRFETRTLRNPAKQAAAVLFEKLVCIYGAVGYREVVAKRWKSQINTNSKSIACVGTYPDVAGGEISGWELAERQCRDSAVVFLRDAGEKGDIIELMDASKIVLEGLDTLDVDMKGATTVEKLLYGVYMGDYVSYYLSLLYEVDPSVTENVQRLQEAMVKEPEA